MPLTWVRLLLRRRTTSERAEVALVQWFEIDRHASAVERGIGAVGADKRRETLDRGILQDDLGQFLLRRGHGGKGDGCRRLRDALDHARILHREEALGNDNVEKNGEHQGAQRDQQGEGLVAQDHLERAAIEGDHALENALRCLVETALLLRRVVAQDAGAHHRGQGQRDHGGDDDGDRQGHGKLAEQPAHDIAHEEQRE